MSVTVSKRVLFITNSGLKLYIEADGIKRGHRTMAPAAAMQDLTKGDRRKIRRLADKTGHRNVAIQSFLPVEDAPLANFKWHGMRLDRR